MKIKLHIVISFFRNYIPITYATRNTPDAAAPTTIREIAKVQNSGATAAITPKTTCNIDDTRKVIFLPHLKYKYYLFLIFVLVFLYLSDVSPNIIDPNITPTMNIELHVAIK